MKTNYHCHTTFCDGANTPDEMAAAALAKGFDVFGFSSHSDMLKDIPAYIAAIRDLQSRYATSSLKIVLGMEAEGGDSLGYRAQLDYVIGSVHYIHAPDGERCAIDHTPQILSDVIRDHFGGDAIACVKAYFAAVRDSLKFDFDIVGHPDLIRKFNLHMPESEGRPLFDLSAAWYRGELEATADAIAASGKIVEVNTGAISRGWMDDAYPSASFRALLRERGVRFILSSDAHAADTIDCAFDRFGNCEAFCSSF